MSIKKDHFEKRAKEWDKKNSRVINAAKIAEIILGKIDFTEVESVMDFGAGTGLLSEGIAPNVNKLAAVDYSKTMLDEFQMKNWPCETEVFPLDLTKENIDQQFDGIISSMTLHHIEDIPLLFSRFSTLLKPGGFVALADLDKEDGSFHINKSGVYHFGFERMYIQDRLSANGFSTIRFHDVHSIGKEVGDRLKYFPVFLVIAYKQ